MATITIDEGRYTSVLIKKDTKRVRRQIPENVRALRGVFKDVVPNPADERMMHILGK